MQKITKSVLCLILLFQCLSFVYANTKSGTDAEYVKALNMLFDVSGNTELYNMTIKQILAILREQHPDISEENWIAIEKEFTEVSLNELTVMLMPVYKKYLTIDDLKEIIKFYNTPVGRKYSKNLLPLTQDAMMVGSEWGRKIGQKFSERIDDLD
ncbi:MAG: DUF2059 domain-containing protein [Leptospirales bacterium]|nr:DUF2059 domain-containing protein [Leptospirales bacterium]